MTQGFVHHLKQKQDNVNTMQRKGRSLGKSSTFFDILKVTKSEFCEMVIVKHDVIIKFEDHRRDQKLKVKVFRSK